MNNEDVKQLLLQSGVSPDVFATTLPLSGYPEIRKYLSDDLGEIQPVMYFYPNKKNGGALAGQILDLTCKELVLMGRSVKAVSLVDVFNALVLDTDESHELKAEIVNAEVVGIRDFYQVDGNVNCYFTPYQQAMFYSFVRKLLIGGTCLLLQGERPLAESVAWWSAGFVNYLENKGRHFVVRTEGKT